MKRIATAVAAAVLVTAVAMSVRGMAAESQTTVKVALTDMSSSIGMGPMGQGMMGPGMMGGYGMMGPGMMGPGMMRGNMMMGPGMMMSMMAIRTDQGSVKAGSVRFDVTNWSRSIVHEVLVGAVDTPAAQLPYDYTQAKVIEDQVKVLGDTSELQPNASHALDLTLAPGSYLLICNVAGHYAAGMATPLTVTP